MLIWFMALLAKLSPPDSVSVWPEAEFSGATLNVTLPLLRMLMFPELVKVVLVSLAEPKYVPLGQRQCRLGTHRRGTVELQGTRVEGRRGRITVGSRQRTCATGCERGTAADGAAAAFCKGCRGANANCRATVKKKKPPKKKKHQSHA